MEKHGYVVIYDDSNGTGTWGWYETLPEAEDAKEECVEELEISEDGWFQWVKVLPCYAYMNKKEA